MGDSERSPRVWRRSSRSGGTNCVEVCLGGESVFMRDSRDPDGAVLEFPFPEWEAFVTGVIDGEFKIP